MSMSDDKLTEDPYLSKVRDLLLTSLKSTQRGISADGSPRPFHNLVKISSHKCSFIMICMDKVLGSISVLKKNRHACVEGKPGQNQG